MKTRKKTKIKKMNWVLIDLIVKYVTVTIFLSLNWMESIRMRTSNIVGKF